MPSPALPYLAIWIIAALAILGVILRPFRWPEAIWAVAGALILVAAKLLSPAQALAGVMKGTDVYLFLTGMMALSEVARREGLFDWLASHAVRQAKGSAKRLFILIYGAGILVTVFLSNDATAVVLTPAVYAAATAAGAKPLPYLYICAFIANAASFVLPISNPANLVVYGAHMPALGAWIARFGLASLASILLTFWTLRWTQRDALGAALDASENAAPLTLGGKIAAAGLVLAAIALLAASQAGLPLGAPAFGAGLVTLAIVLIAGRQAPWPVLASMSWSILPLVAGLFVLVEALETTGLLTQLAEVLARLSAASGTATGWAAGFAVALACNVMNNLPAGLIAGAAVNAAHVPERISAAILTGIDLGPNLSVTGSLATILWLSALRREGEHVSAWRFLKLGLVVMPPALAAALLVLLIFS